MFRIRVVGNGFAFDQVCAPDNIIHSGESHFGQMLADLLCQECEEIYQIFTTPMKAFT